jgi:hypothetical protein
MNSKNKVIVATYTKYVIFKIPIEFENLDDKTIVEDWGVKWETLHIKPVGKDWIEVEASADTEGDNKHPNAEVEDWSDYEHLLDEDEEEDE